MQWLVSRLNLDHQEQVPRKQGLKPAGRTDIDKLADHQEQVPRKQGLKPQNGTDAGFEKWSSRTSSTKTRIETFVWFVSAPSRRIIKNKFHENKD